MMLEVFIGLVFLFALLISGRSVILVCSAKDRGWLAMPMGLCMTGLIANLLYFGIGLTVPWIQRLFLGAMIPCLFWNIRRGIGLREWGGLLAVFGIFLLLALPAWIGGEQYYVFRGNHWDHFNYINQALALWNNPYSAYRNVSAGRFLDNDVFAHALLFIGKRPAVGLVFALLLPAGTGNIHLLAFFYVTALWSLVFPAIFYAWKQILDAYEFKTNGICLSICPPLAYVVGFWGQYIFDINAWSQMASLSLQLSLTFTYLRLLQHMVDSPTDKGLSGMSDYVITGLLAASVLLFYPENAMMEALFLLAATLLWCVATRSALHFRAIVSLAILSVLVLIISSASDWEGTIGFVLGQIKFGVGQGPDWWKFFDSYWHGLHTGISGPTGRAGTLINLIVALAGMFFITPDYSAPFWLRYPWIVFAAVGAILAVYSLGVSLLMRFRANRTSVFLKLFFLSGIVFLLCLLWKGALWSLGKGLSILSPYLFLMYCVSFVESIGQRNAELVRPRTWGNVLTGWFVIFLIISQIAFGIARLWAARDVNGIGYDSATYPSIQGDMLKTLYSWNMEPDQYLQCKGVRLYSQNPFYLEYMKQKLTYLHVPYFSPLPVMSHFDGGYKIGYQHPIITDCNAVLMKEPFGKWHSASKPSPFDGVIDFVRRNPMVSFEGISGVETWGSWTEGKRSRIFLPKLLPDSFTLELDVMYIFDSNVGKPFQICVAGQKQAITFMKPGIYSLTFHHVKNASDIEIIVPDPVSPQSLGRSNDRRLLGLGLKQVRILPIG